MTKIDFTKMQALGNDFVILDARKAPPAGIANLTRRMCDRHFGVGADGVMLILSSKKADFRMRIYNADGSEAEMCGNGIRCFAKYLYDRGLTKKTELAIETKAGIIRPHLLLRGKTVAAVRVDLGEPRLASQEIPISGPARLIVLNEPLVVKGKAYDITCVSMGNPHCVLFWPDVAGLQIETLGPAIEGHANFPRRTNVEFVEVLAPGELRMRVWERGVGETLACGTGAAATLVAAVLNGKAARRAVLHLQGGDLKVEWLEKTNHVFITGPAKEVFRGNWPLK
jgi:diaminopimelate epimerase